MNTDTLISIVVGLALVVWISYRQLTWTPVIPEKMWRMPAILAVVGLVSVAGVGLRHVTGVDVAVLAIETVTSLGLGVAMGALAHFRSTNGTLETRNGWFGMALWIALIGIRVLAEVWAHSSGSALLLSTGVILLTVAVNRGARILVIVLRAQRRVVPAAEARVAA